MVFLAFLPDDDRGIKDSAAEKAVQVGFRGECREERVSVPSQQNLNMGSRSHFGVHWACLTDSMPSESNPCEAYSMPGHLLTYFLPSAAHQLRFGPVAGDGCSRLLGHSAVR